MSDYHFLPHACWVTSIHSLHNLSLFRIQKYRNERHICDWAVCVVIPKRQLWSCTDFCCKWLTLSNINSISLDTCKFICCSFPSSPIPLLRSLVRVPAFTSGVSRAAPLVKGASFRKVLRPWEKVWKWLTDSHTLIDDAVCRSNCPLAVVEFGTRWTVIASRSGYLVRGIHCVICLSFARTNGPKRPRFSGGPVNPDRMLAVFRSASAHPFFSVLSEAPVNPDGMLAVFRSVSAHPFFQSYQKPQSIQMECWQCFFLFLHTRSFQSYQKPQSDVLSLLSPSSRTRTGFDPDRRTNSCFRTRISLFYFSR
jgi:hypothetical protein